MTLEFTPLHPRFVAQASPIALREVFDPAVLAEVRAGMDRHAVLVFRDQAFADDEQLDFARRLDGRLHEKTGSRVVSASRLGNEALTDISNVAADGGLLARQDRRRLYSLANRPGTRATDMAPRPRQPAGQSAFPTAAAAGWPVRRARHSTLGSIRSTITSTPAGFGWMPSAWLRAATVATPSSRNG